MFTPYPQDPIEAGLRRIQEVMTFPTAWTAYDIRHADLEQQEEWLRWSQCLVTNISGQQFSDLFPKEAISRYRDRSGNPLPGLCPHKESATRPRDWQRYMSKERQAGHFATGDPAVYWEQVGYPDTVSVASMENYLRIKALPTAINVLLSAFQNGHRVSAEIAQTYQNSLCAQSSYSPE